MEIKFTVPGSPKGKQRPRICKVNGRSVAYTPKETIEYEKLIRARCVAATEALCALTKSRPNQSATDKSRFTRNGSGSYPFERNLPLEISILALYPIPKYVSRKTKELMLNGRLFPTKKPDADNIIKVILDALNGLAYRDDVQICRVYFEKMYAEIPETKVLIKNYEVD